MADFRAFALTVEAHPEEGGYLACFPALPGCQTWGDSYEEAIRNAEEALAVYLDTLVANGDPIPEAELSARPMSLGILVRTDLAA